MPNRNALHALDLLVGFEAAARHLSFTKAGEELYLTQ
jgi:DNA-binding transcriptional LysR family regulator